jgi:hypothetical protein
MDKFAFIDAAEIRRLVRMIAATRDRPMRDVIRAWLNYRGKYPHQMLHMRISGHSAVSYAEAELLRAMAKGYWPGDQPEEERNTTNETA